MTKSYFNKVWTLVWGNAVPDTRYPVSSLVELFASLYALSFSFGLIIILTITMFRLDYKQDCKIYFEFVDNIILYIRDFNITHI